MKVIAFLQNQWFKDPERAAKLLERYQEHEGDEHAGRERFIRDMLFFGCLTGRRLEQVFGEELCGYGGIVWEESSKHMGGHSAACGEVDPQHMLDVIVRHKPDVVLLFGAKAAEGWKGIGKHDALTNLKIIKGPHPAARGSAVVGQLRAMAEQLCELMKKETT